ncbi:MAG TPA: FG-GAP-like repeat-containing protein, partial [Chitinophagales bacterium]|nr:FG-GAP-like repeat-containing protein [Chitinophagales bacterium]
YENDGAGNFGAQQIITTATNGINSVFAADLDGDGDIDVLSASAYDDKIAWFENDGVGNFGSQQIIASVLNGICAVYAADLDGDGDLDVLSNSQHQIVWFENDGVGNFGAQQIIFLSFIGCSVFIEDMDLDGDIDITARSSGKLVWFENDGLGNFSMKQTNLSYDDNATYYAVDLDSDDDIDIIRTTNLVFVNGSGYHLSSAITWAENEGMGNFSPYRYITTAVKGILSVCTDDLDGDGDLDVLSASLLDDKIAWYENLLYNPRISGKVFYDANQNGILESTEFGIPFQNISVEPESLYTYANNNGFFTFYYQTAGTYTLNYTVPDNWSTTTPTSYTVTLAEGQVSLNHNFGIYPNTLVTSVKPYLTSGINRCNWQVPYHLSIVNEGTTIVPLSVICLQLDPQLSYINATPMPDSIGTQGWLYWHVSNFLPAQQTQITVLVQEPDFTAMGDTLFNNVIVESYDSNEQRTGLNSFSYTPLVTCSYDPNDKQVTPLGIKEQNYTLIGQELFYTIRFQNTGNDTAFNVIIADTLSAWVNHHTFRIINSSHPMQTKRHSNGLVEFYFKNIMLPNSTVNEPGSHGYILYAVQLVANLPDNTPITNTAYIYFDQNPAIVTNTVKNTMVYELPIDKNSANTTGISLVALTPNPTQNTAT